MFMKKEECSSLLSLTQTGTHPFEGGVWQYIDLGITDICHISEQLFQI